MGVKKFVIVTEQKSFGKRSDLFCPQKMTKNSSRRTPRRNFDHQIGKIQKKKSKMMKIRIVINSDVEVVAHPEVVQNTFKTLKLPIFDHISSLK